MGLIFKDQLKGERLILKRTIPTLGMATTMFKVIDENRQHLKPWMPWVDLTLTVEDTMKYLFEKEVDTLKGQKVEYGIFINDEYIGNISVFDINQKNHSAEMGYWLSAHHVRKGYMTEAVQILEKEAFTHLNLNRIQICCDEQNQASAGVAKKCGYKYEGILREYRFSEYFGEFRNKIFFSKLRSEYK